eukprot:372875-Prymnesium_polylepis.1
MAARPLRLPDNLLPLLGARTACVLRFLDVEIASGHALQRGVGATLARGVRTLGARRAEARPRKSGCALSLEAQFFVHGFFPDGERRWQCKRSESRNETKVEMMLTRFESASPPAANCFACCWTFRWIFFGFCWTLPAASQTPITGQVFTGQK